jgi:hypothetical protein
MGKYKISIEGSIKKLKIDLGLKIDKKKKVESPSSTDKKEKKKWRFSLQVVVNLDIKKQQLKKKIKFSCERNISVFAVAKNKFKILPSIEISKANME